MTGLVTTTQLTPKSLIAQFQILTNLKMQLFHRKASLDLLEAFLYSYRSLVGTPNDSTEEALCCVRTAYALMRCTGSPCTSKGSHCRDHKGKHYRLLPYHIRMPVNHLQSGGVLNGHDDVLENFRQQIFDKEREWEERQQKEGEKERKRRRTD